MNVRDPFEILTDEHRRIERVLSALNAYADTIERGDDADGRVADLARFVTFLRELADGQHHAKEEEVLFEAMSEHGFSRETGPVGAMLAEHKQGRALVAELADIATLDAWSEPDKKRMVRSAREFVALLRAHIQKEDNVLYVMAQRTLPEGALAWVRTRIHEIEAAHAAEGRTERLYQLGDELARRYT